MMAASEEWDRLTGGSVEWAFRPLASFNDEPIEDFTAGCDLLILDHPLVPAAAERGALIAIDELASPQQLATIAAAGVGRSHDSYTWRDRQWALPVDAACHVSCRRQDLLDRQRTAVPTTWAGVLELAAAMPGRVAVPLLPADAVCALVTISASRGVPLRLGAGVDRRSVAILTALASQLHPASFTQSPPQLLERMATTDDIVYMPVTFGYSSFAADQPGSRRLQFAAVPGSDAAAGVGVLGGAGIAISSSSSHAAEAAAFAAWVCSDRVQRDIVREAGGQPAARSAWMAPSGSHRGFFDSTLAAIEGAVVRPRHPRWPSLQRALGERLAEGLSRGETERDLAATLDSLMQAADMLEEQLA